MASIEVVLVRVMATLEAMAMATLEAMATPEATQQLQQKAETPQMEIRIGVLAQATAYAFMENFLLHFHLILI